MSIELIIGSVGLFLTLLVLVLTVASFLFMARSDYRHLDAKIDAIHEEMKDFHSRLEKQDMEFKVFLRSQEEIRTKLILGSP